MPEKKLNGFGVRKQDGRGGEVGSGNVPKHSETFRNIPKRSETFRRPFLNNTTGRRRLQLVPPKTFPPSMRETASENIGVVGGGTRKTNVFDLGQRNVSLMLRLRLRQPLLVHLSLSLFTWTLPEERGVPEPPSGTPLRN